MPISHLLSESFFGDQEHFQVEQPENGKETVFRKKIRNVQFHQDGELSPSVDVNFSGPILIDTDGGVFSTWPIIMALSSANNEITGSKVDIVGVTTVNGCTTVENAVRNVGWLMQNLGRVNHDPVPIYKGMDSPLTKAPGSRTKKPSFFGSDGFGNLEGLPPSEGATIPTEREHAVQGIIRLAEEHKGQLTIVCLGPLTNLAMALKLHPRIRHQVKEIFIAGGNSEATGNMTVTGEFNFYVDPEAAKLVLEGFDSCPMHILPWETCLRSGALSQSFRINAISTLNTPLIELLNKIENKFLHEDSQWIMPGAVLMACLLNREVIRKVEHYHCTVETQGQHTRGMMVVDKNFVRQSPANVALITEVNQSSLKQMLIAFAGSHENESNGLWRQHERKMDLQTNYF